MTGCTGMAESYAGEGSDWTWGFYFILFFTASVIKHWKRLPSVVVDVPCLSVFKRDLDKPLINMFPTALFHSIWFYSVLFLCVFSCVNQPFIKKKKKDCLLSFTLLENEVKNKHKHM